LARRWVGCCGAGVLAAAAMSFHPAQAYYFDQLTGDSGPGAALGPFKGYVVGAGASVWHDVMLGTVPAVVTLRALADIDARNRLQSKSVWLDLTFPLAVKPPRTAPAP